MIRIKILTFFAVTCLLSGSFAYGDVVTFTDLDFRTADTMDTFDNVNFSINGGTTLSTQTLGRNFVPNTNGGNDLVVPFSITNDFDSNGANETLTFEILVTGSEGNTVSGTPDGNDGVVILDSTGVNNVFDNSGAIFTAIGDRLRAGSNLQFTAQNISLPGFTTSFNGFDTFDIDPFRRSDSHNAVLGVGTGLQVFSADDDETFNLAAPEQTLSLTSLDLGGDRPNDFGISNVGFAIEVTPAAVPEPSSLALLALGSIGFLSRRRR